MSKSNWWIGIAGACSGAVVVGAVWFGTTQMNKNGPVIATVGNNAIHQDEFVQKLKDAGGSQTLSSMLTTQLIADAAKKYNVAATDTDVNNALMSIELSNGISSEAQLQALLAQNNMTLAQLKDNLKTQVLAEKVSEHLVNVTDAQIQKYYKANKASFTTPPTVSLSSIVVKSQSTANTVENALKSGTKFADAAKKYSIDTATKAYGGAEGNLSKAEMDPSLQNLAFSLPVGQASQPVKTAKGWEIIQVTSKQPAKLQPLSQVKSQISQTLKRQNAEAPAQLLAKLAKSDPITIKDPAFTSVKTQIENPAPAAPTPSAPTPGQ